MSPITIKRIVRTELDAAKWNALVQTGNSEVYLQSWYLDVVWPNWEALVIGDYDAAIPVFEKKSWLGNVVSQPSFTDAIHAFGNSAQVKNLTEEYLKTIHSAPHVYASVITSEENGTRRFQRWKRADVTNYPAKVLRRNLRKADAAGFTAIDAIGVKQFIEELKKNLRDKSTGYLEKHYQLLERLIQVSLENRSGFLVGIKTETGWHAGQFYVTCGHQCYLVSCFSDDYSRANSGLHFLLHSIFEKMGDNAEVHFGGSNIPAIAEFNKNFGAEDEFYRIHQKSFMPGPLKKLVPF